MLTFSLAHHSLLLTATTTTLWSFSRAMSSSKNVAAVAQLCSTSNKRSNLIAVAHCAYLATQQDASMLFLPECFGYLGTSSQETVQQAEPAMGETVAPNDARISKLLASVVQHGMYDTDGTQKQTNPEESLTPISLLHGLQVIAQTSGLWISGGGMHESGAPNGRIYNTHVILDNTGTIQSHYHKSHLFDVSIPQHKVHLQESATTAAGERLVVCDSPLGRLGLSTCYDVRFPEVYAELVERGGAQILLVPSAFTVPTGKAHWHVLLRARAIETQCYVLAAAQCGRHNSKRESYGHSLAVDPWGTVVADATNTAAPSIVSCTIDLGNVDSIRERMPIQRHRQAAGTLSVQAHNGKEAL